MRREDFTRQLIECLNTKQCGRTIISSWEPDAIAAPERHIQCGIQNGYSDDKMYDSIMKSNQAFDTIESMLNILFTKSHLKSLRECTMHDEKEHVWLFAYKWLTKYYDFLMEPDVLHSPFYRQDHDRFIELLTKMCAVLPEKRITFLDAARLWSPGALTSSNDTHDESQDETKPDDESVDAADAPCVVASPVTDGPSMNHPPSSDSSVRRRLVLKGFHGHQGRSKTRKSSRS
jgi:hypothetical protein